MSAPLQERPGVKASQIHPLIASSRGGITEVAAASTANLAILWKQKKCSCPTTAASWALNVRPGGKADRDRLQGQVDHPPPPLEFEGEDAAAARACRPQLERSLGCATTGGIRPAQVSGSRRVLQNGPPFAAEEIEGGVCSTNRFGLCPVHRVLLLPPISYPHPSFPKSTLNNP